MNIDIKEISIQDLYWLAGLLEGEVWFGWKGTPVVTIQMSDLDIIQRVAGMFERKYYPVRKDKRNKKGRQMYHVSISSIAAIKWMDKLYPLMGERRQKQIKNAKLKFRKQLQVIPRLQVNQIAKIKYLYQVVGGYTQQQLSQMFGTSLATVGRILREERYSRVKPWGKRIGEYNK